MPKRLYKALTDSIREYEDSLGRLLTDKEIDQFVEKVLSDETPTTKSFSKNGKAGKRKRKVAPSTGLDISSGKACKILNDGEVHGQPLTERQRGMFGAKCGQQPKPKKSTQSKRNSLTVVSASVPDGDLDMTKRHKANVMFLTRNCDCGYKDQAKQLASLPEDHVQAIADVERKKQGLKVEDKKAPTGNDSGEGVKDKKTPEAKTVTANTTTDDSTTTTTNKDSTMTYEKWLELAPPEVKERDEFAKNLVDNEKKRIVLKLTANVKDPEDKTLKRNRLLKKSLKDLKELEELVPVVPTNNRSSFDDDNGADDYAYILSGPDLSSQRREQVTNSQGVDEDDWLPTINYTKDGVKKKLAKGSKKKVMKDDEEEDEIY